jgi:hypothetical protein
MLIASLEVSDSVEPEFAEPERFADASVEVFASSGASQAAKQKTNIATNNKIAIVFFIMMPFCEAKNALRKTQPFLYFAHRVVTQTRYNSALLIMFYLPA